jgi:hypothetical protein
MKKLSFKEYLIEVFDTEHSDEMVHQPYNSDEDHKNFVKKLSSARKSDGSGAFGYIERDKDNPFTVNKQPHKAEDSIENDAYYRYITYVTKNKLAQENPFLPRVYSVKNMTDSNLKQKYKIDIETLTPLTDLSTAQLSQMGRTLFSDFDETFKQLNGTSGAAKSVVRKVLADTIAQCLENNITARANNIENQLLHQALTTIRKVKMSGRFAYDFGSNNIMARMSAHGPQLVLVDPLA